MTHYLNRAKNNRHGSHWPTQLAASRVDAAWNTVDTFSVLFRPKDASFQDWNHMAFFGWNRQAFLDGEALYSGLVAFQKWLRPDDIICWWHQEANDLYNMFTKIAQVRNPAGKVIFLGDYIYGFLSSQKASVGSPYKLCAARGIPVPEPAHCSQNDILAIQALVKGIGFQQSYLLQPPKKWVKDYTALKGTTVFPLLYDPDAKLLHRSDCELLPEDKYLPAYTSFKAPIRRKYKPCSCCREEYLDALWERNQDTIERKGINFSRQVQTAIQAPQKQAERNLAKGEKSAIGRFKWAKEERETTLKKGVLTDSERNTVMALSQPGLAFWASRGYRTFHRRNCPQITGLTQLVGFPRYQDAVHAGYCPCRHCKPSPKQNVVFLSRSQTRSVLAKQRIRWYSSARSTVSHSNTTIGTLRCRRWWANGELT